MLSLRKHNLLLYILKKTYIKNYIVVIVQTCLFTVGIYLHKLINYFSVASTFPDICFTSGFLSFLMYNCSFLIDFNLNVTGTFSKIGFVFCKHLIHDNRESLEDVPVAHIA